MKLIAIIFISLSALPLLEAKNQRIDKVLTDAMEAERSGEYDKVYELIRVTAAARSSDMAYQLARIRIGFEAGAYHVHHAQQAREAGRAAEALKEFELAYSMDPASGIALQEIRRTKLMLQGPQPEKGLTPAEQEKKEQSARIDSIQPAPQLRPLSNIPINLKMTNRPRVLFDTIGRLACMNIVFDPEYDTQAGSKQETVELHNATLQQALDTVAILTKSFWKPLASNTLFVTQDTRQKRQDYEDQIVKVFYLTNVTQQAELNEVVTLLRTVADIQKIFISTPLNAIVLRGETDKIRLAEKLISAVDKPKSEVIVDVMVMEVNRGVERDLSAAFATSGINSSLTFTPRSKMAGQTGSSSSGNNTVLLSNMNKISTVDYTVSNVPGALIEALLTDSRTRVLQAPQLRALDNVKSSLKVGEKVPTATGSYSAGTGSTAVNALVNTQFTYLDVGVNMDLLARVHDANEVTVHLGVEVSQVTGTIPIGGVDEPEIGQRRFELDLRMRDGEVNLIGGLMKDEEDKSISGVPGLAQVPLLKRLFSSENVTRTQNELLIALVPHIIRSPEITRADTREAATGNGTSIKLNLKTNLPANEQ